MSEGESGGGGKKKGFWGWISSGGEKNKPVVKPTTPPVEDDIYKKLGMTRKGEQKSIDTAQARPGGGISITEALNQGAVSGTFHGEETRYRSPVEVHRQQATAKRVKELQKELEKFSE